VEQQIAPTCLDPVTGVIAKTAERFQKKVTGMSLSIPLMRDPLNDDGLGCDTTI